MTLKVAARNHEVARRRASRVTRVVPGVAVASAIAVVATALARQWPVVGAPVIAVILGVVVALRRAPSSSWAPGVRLASKRFLQWSVILFGAQLSLRDVATIGLSSAPVLLGTLVLALAAAWWLGRALNVQGDLRTLIGVGTAICGASAIAATDAVLGADERDVSVAVATIFTFNVTAVVLYPLLGHWWHLSPRSFGLWAGTSINDVSSVVAAASSYAHASSSYAIVVKLTRTLAIVPITLTLAAWRRRSLAASSSGATSATTSRSSFPWFVVWFLVVVGANSLGLVPTWWVHAAGRVGQFLLVAALAGVGLSTRPRAIRDAGLRPLVLGASLWVVVSGSSLALQALTGTLH
ncbi:MAG: putative sulfate exporter family transporter [Acidobacteriota bacterium]|nr:putative sulfate exporter family transporter [Acidobacteriota bacterium]